MHAPLAAHLEEVRWLPGERRSVAPGVLARVPGVLASNERVVLVLRGGPVPVWLVMVGALNVGRIRVVGVEPGSAPPQPLAFARGAELARFEMGSTVVLIVPGANPLSVLAAGASVRLGEPLARIP